MAAPSSAPASASEPPSRAEPSAVPPERPHRYRLAFLITFLLVALVVLALPFTVQSLLVELIGAPINTLYELTSDHRLVAVRSGQRPPASAYFSVVIAGIDEATRLATLRVSGQRSCAAMCAPLTIVFFSVNDDAAQRRALPPSASLEVAKDTKIISGTIQLPVRGQPSLYPFDSYDLWLGVAAYDVQPDGSQRALSRAEAEGLMQITLQAEPARLLMDTPHWVDPPTVQATGDPVEFVDVLALRFTRPYYLKALAALLVLLIGMSGCLAVFLRPIQGLFLGVGGVILGVWGVRAVIVQGMLPYVTGVDLALSGVIVFILLALAGRATFYFYGRSGLRPPRRRAAPEPTSPRPAWGGAPPEPDSPRPPWGGTPH